MLPKMSAQETFKATFFSIVNSDGIIYSGVQYQLQSKHHMLIKFTDAISICPESVENTKDYISILLFH